MAHMAQLHPRFGVDLMAKLSRPVAKGYVLAEVFRRGEAGIKFQDNVG